MATLRVSRRVHGACFTGDVARAGLFVYATGRSSRVSGRSEIDRPETIEETGDRIRAAGGQGSALVVDHEDPAEYGWERDDGEGVDRFR